MVMFPSSDDLVAHVRNFPERGARELAKSFLIDGEGFRDFVNLLMDLQRAGRLVRIPALGWAVPESGPYRVGRLAVNARGYGSVKVFPADGGDPTRYAIRNLGVAAAGDLVLIKVRRTGAERGRGRSQPEPRPRARLIEIIERGGRLFRGRFSKLRTGAFVRQATGHPAEIFIPPEHVGEAVHDDLVLVKLLPAAVAEELPRGEIVARLDEHDSHQSDLATVQAEFELPGPFPAAVKTAAKRARDLKSNQRWPQRIDLRDQQIFTIDPDDAKDFDDAISLESLDDGKLRLGVHIADVSHYVAPSSTLDKEAESRGTTVYLPGAVIPMLPERLSNDLCSLRPLEDRLTKTVWMTFDETSYELLSTEIVRSVIRSQRRFTYDEALSLLGEESATGDPAEDPPEDADEYRDTFAAMAQLRDALRRRRYERGGLFLDLPKLSVEVDSEGEAIGLSREQSDGAHRLIEEFMVAANEAVAAFHIDKDLPLASRVHPPPDDDRFGELKVFLKALEVPFLGDPTPQALQKLVENVRDDVLGAVVQLALLRTMGHAEYDEGRGLHFALATTSYCHFTSPIRRYPDLLMHQVLDLHLDGKIGNTAGGPRRRSTWRNRLSSVLVEASELERRAEDAERAMSRLKLIRFLEPRVGEEMGARVSYVYPFGFFVRVEDNLVEGLVPVGSLGDDYYEYDEKALRLSGRRNRRSYGIGDRVRVQLTEVNADTREITFGIVGGKKKRAAVKARGAKARRK